MNGGARSAARRGQALSSGGALHTNFTIQSPVGIQRMGTGVDLDSRAAAEHASIDTQPPAQNSATLELAVSAKPDTAEITLDQRIGDQTNTTAPSLLSSSMAIHQTQNNIDSIR